MAKKPRHTAYGGGPSGKTKYLKSAYATGTGGGSMVPTAFASVLAKAMTSRSIWSGPHITTTGTYTSPGGSHFTLYADALYGPYGTIVSAKSDPAQKAMLIGGGVAVTLDALGMVFRPIAANWDVVEE